MSKNSSYGAKDITVLEGLEAVRKRPGMYIGTTGPEGLHHLIWEVFDNSRDEAMAGYANDIEVALLPNNMVRVADNGRGIPVDIHPKTKVSALETIMTTLHAGGKFGGGGYKYSGGLHGVGVSVVNALSVYAKAEVHRDGGRFVQEYEKGGKPKYKVKKLGKSDKTGTIITFQPDEEIFKTIKFNWKTIVSHLRQQAYLVPSMRVSILDLREVDPKEFEKQSKDVFYLREIKPNVPSVSFYFEGGLRSFIKFQNRHQKPIHSNVFYTKGEQDDVIVEVALQYVDDISARISAFANNIYNPEGGTHVTGFKTALTRTLNAYVKKNNIKVEEAFSGDDVLEGLTAIISVKMKEIQFEGQTKAKLGSVEARSATEAVFSKAFAEFLEEHPTDAKAIIQKAQLAQKARKAAKAAKESVLRKSALEGMTLPGKLADCQVKNAEEAELFIVEGDSAGGCFVGSTEVLLASGVKTSLERLTEMYKLSDKRVKCFSITPGKEIEIVEVQNPRLTKHVGELAEVTLEDKSVIESTLDHQFMLQDGSYKQAKDLSDNDQLATVAFKKPKAIVYIDGANLYYGEKNSGWKLDLEKLKKYLESNFELVDYKYYTAVPDESDKEAYNLKNSYIQKIKDIASVHTKPLKYIKDEGKIVKKGDVDVDIAVDALAQTEPEVFVFVTGDSDFVALKDALLKKGKKVLFVTFKSVASFEIKQGKYVLLDKIKELVEYGNNEKTPAQGEGTLVPLLYPISQLKSMAYLSAKRVQNIQIKQKASEVYDIETQPHHNFALGNGVFVHNSSKQGRDRRTQAVLPLRGKILNVERARLDKMLANNEIKALTVALGAGIGDAFNIDKIRYHKIIIATDADVDGAHIRTLLLTLFYRYFRPVIEKGYLYIAQPPLYKIKAGKKVYYAYSDEEKDEIVQKLGEEKVDVQRYKGLGEMNPEELWETTMDPQNRLLKQITIKDAQEANEVFDTLMGTDVASRKSFIQANAKQANLDI